MREELNLGEKKLNRIKAILAFRFSKIVIQWETHFQNKIVLLRLNNKVSEIDVSFA